MSAAVVLLRVDADGHAAGHHPRHRYPALDLKYIQAALATADGDTPPLIDHALMPELSAAELATRVLALRPRIVVVRAQSWNAGTAIACARRLRAGGVVTVAIGQQVLHARRSPLAGWHEAYDIALAGDAEAATPRVIAQLLAGAEPAEAAALTTAGVGASVMHKGSLLAVTEPDATHSDHPLAITGPDATHRARVVTITPAADAPNDRLLEITDPDALPPPRFDVDELAAYPFPFPLRCRPLRRWGYVLTAWGCPRACRHCSVVVRKSAGTLLRPRSLARVADEVARLADAGAEGILFEDDSLLVDRRRFLALCDTLVQRGLTLPWIANARPDELDAERVAAAAASGAALFKVGVDCAAPRLIERIGKAKDGAAWIAAAHAAFARLDTAGIASVALFMVGLPDETRDEVEASIELARRLRPDYLQVQVFTPYPDTALWAELDAEQRAGAGSYHYGARKRSPSRIAAAELPALQARFYRRFYLDPGYVARHLARSWRHYLSLRTLLASAGHAGWLLRRAASGAALSGKAP